MYPVQHVTHTGMMLLWVDVYSIILLMAGMLGQHTEMVEV
jgi:hypothetical protein